MADGIMQLVARLPSVSGLPEDTYENVINVLGTDTYTPTELDVMLNAFRDFFIALNGAQTNIVGSYIGSSVARSAGGCSILAYFTTDLTGATPFGSPEGQRNFTMTNPVVGSTPMPEEVAAVISYHGDLDDVPVSQINPTPPPATIRPAQRRRGRLYLGPLNTGSGSSPSSQWRPTTTFRTQIGLAFAEMCNDINASTFGSVAVWSKTAGEAYPALAGYVDDAWDTQRRRGAKATTRTTFTIA